MNQNAYDQTRNALGDMTIVWNQNEFLLFALFRQLAELKSEPGRIVWFNVVSLRTKLDMMRQLAKASGA